MERTARQIKRKWRLGITAPIWTLQDSPGFWGTTRQQDARVSQECEWNVPRDRPYPGPLKMFNKFKRTEILQNMFSHHNTLKSEIKNRINLGQSQVTGGPIHCCWACRLAWPFWESWQMPNKTMYTLSFPAGNPCLNPATQKTHLVHKTIGVQGRPLQHSWHRKTPKTTYTSVEVTYDGHRQARLFPIEIPSWSEREGLVSL